MTAGRSMRHVGSVCLALMLSASGIDAAFGGIIANSPTGLVSPTGVITFNLPVLAQDAQVTNQFSGVSFDPGTIYSFLQSSYPVLEGHYV